MKDDNRIILNVVLSFVIVFCAIMTVFLIVKKREIDRRETFIILTSEPVSPIENYVEKVNYAISLNSIINGYQFNNQYNLNIQYRDIDYSFNCISYYNNICSSGKASFTYNEIVFPLYEYFSDDDNYLKKPFDLIIIKNGNKFAILRGNTLSLYNEFGELTNEFNDVIIRYSEGEFNYEKKYPSYNENIIEYYKCTNNKAYFTSVDLNNLAEIKTTPYDNSYCEFNK